MTLAELMDQKGLSIKELAKKPGCSESTIKRALKGENLHDNSKKNMAAGLGVSIEELSESIKAQLPPDPIAKLVDETIQKLKILGLEFKPPKDNSNADISESIRNDLCGGELSYFLDEFDDIVQQVSNGQEKEAQFKALKGLILYSITWLVNRALPVDMKKCTQLTLRDGKNAWELRLYINTLLQKLEGVHIELIYSEENNVYELSDVKDAYQLGSSNNAVEVEMFCKLVKQLTAQEPIKPACPEQVLSEDSPEWEALMACCKKLNQRLLIRKNTKNNVFTFSDQVIPAQLLTYITDHLNDLRVLMIQSDKGETLLIQTEIDIETLLIECLGIVAKREHQLLGEATNNAEENDTNKSTVKDIIVNGTTAIFLGDKAKNQQNQ